MIETNTKQNTITTESIKYKLRELHKNIEIVFTDSKDYSITKNEWLPRGIITSYYGKISSLVDKQ